MVVTALLLGVNGHTHKDVTDIVIEVEEKGLEHMSSCGFISYLHMFSGGITQARSIQITCE